MINSEIIWSPSLHDTEESQKDHNFDYQINAYKYVAMYLVNERQKLAKNYCIVLFYSP